MIIARIMMIVGPFILGLSIQGLWKVDKKLAIIGSLGFVLYVIGTYFLYKP